MLPNMVEAVKCNKCIKISIMIQVENFKLMVVDETLKRKVAEYIYEEQFSLRKGKGTRNATIVLRIITK